jgi:hypothetical protein
MARNGIFRVSDVYLSSFLVYRLGVEPTFEKKGSRVLFCFPSSDALYTALQEFNEGVSIDAAEFASLIKRLKGAMYDCKEGKCAT